MEGGYDIFLSDPTYFFRPVVRKVRIMRGGGDGSAKRRDSLARSHRSLTYYYTLLAHARKNGRGRGRPDSERQKGANRKTLVGI